MLHSQWKSVVLWPHREPMVAEQLLLLSICPRPQKHLSARNFIAATFPPVLQPNDLKVFQIYWIASFFQSSKCWDHCEGNKGRGGLDARIIGRLIEIKSECGVPPWLPEIPEFGRWSIVFPGKQSKWRNLEQELEWIQRYNCCKRRREILTHTGKFCGKSVERKKTKFKQKCENGRNGRKVWMNKHGKIKFTLLSQYLYHGF